MSEHETLLIQVEDGIARITIHRPQVMNALSSQTLEELSRALRQIEGDSAAQCVIITGSGDRAFASGADLDEITDLNSAQGRDLSRKGQALFSSIERFRLPVIAAINGFCLGGGCELALSCHLRVASSEARLGQPEVKLGLIPGYGGTQRLPRLIGRGRALELLLTGRMVSAEEALRIGLVNQVVEPEELLPASLELAGKILKNGPLAVRRCIEAVNSGLEMPLEQAMELESLLFGMCVGSEEMKEGIEAFSAKREPRFPRKETHR
ncbi:MAG TPA: enoyl-CoA hydratase-related protein [Acidobacteriota bacterium]|nr:enoyl-CoA hydratase-related protein [Acidobacteriota bacterium]